MYKKLLVGGTRPNLIKITQFKKVARNYPDIDLKIVHTGQHFDDKMADIFFKQFSIAPDFILKAPQHLTREDLINHIASDIESLITTTFKPDLMVVVGDVNSTLSGAIAAKKFNVKLAHVESGLRSFDKTMPEELNRIATDKLTDLFFITEQSGHNNLIKEGVNENKLFFTGNTMIDTMVAFEKEIEQSAVLEKLKLTQKNFVLITMHRPATVDSEEGLNKLLELLHEISKKYNIVFPVHPRTTKNIEALGLKKAFNDIQNLIFTEPLDYFSFQKLIKYCRFIITDSGGIQEESTFLKVPCLTLRPNTERPVTCTLGTNTLIPFDVKTVLSYISVIENGTYKKGEIPPLWDGKATERIFKFIHQNL